MKQTYNTALYMRLSRDDENYGDSVSIETQRTILRQYARDNNLNIVDEYIDDGWSGTNFERPAFIRMMEDVDAGKINCIVTKDLSRFGREHVMMDYYLEFVFPEKQIRYIAVTENEDTEKGLSDFVPFKKGLEAGAEMVLVGHIINKYVDPGVPSSLSRKYQDILYKYLNFNGIIVTDDMAMTGKIDCGIGWGINLITGTFVEIDTMMKKIKPDVTQCAKVLKFLEDMKKRGE